MRINQSRDFYFLLAQKHYLKDLKANSAEMLERPDGIRGLRRYKRGRWEVGRRGEGTNAVPHGPR